jgi:hypothetical protein
VEFEFIFRNLFYVQSEVRPRNIIAINFFMYSECTISTIISYAFGVANVANGRLSFNSMSYTLKILLGAFVVYGMFKSQGWIQLTSVVLIR